MEVKSGTPTESGFYWILEDIGITYSRVVCWVIVPTTPSLQQATGGKIVVISPQTMTRRDAPGPFWNKDLVAPEQIPWDPHKFVAWSGPLKPHDYLIDSTTGETKHWLEVR